MDYYLKTSTEAEMKQALVTAGLSFQEHDGKFVDGTTGFFNDIVLNLGWLGSVSLSIVTEDGGEIDEPPMIDTNFHANLRASEPLPAEVVAILPVIDPYPSQPMRVWG